MNILVIEDRVRLANTIAEALRTQNHIVDIAPDGLQGYENAASGIYDVLVLDLMLPQMNGYEVLSELRKTGINIPVLILSARTELADKVQGFTLGADDYLTKPFEIEELIMRIQAISRRHFHQDIQKLQAGNLLLSREASELINTDNGNSIKISGKELQLCEFLIINYRRVLEKEQILVKIWGYDSDADYNNIEVYISFLRKKLFFLQANVYIRSVHGVGYIMENTND